MNTYKERYQGMTGIGGRNMATVIEKHKKMIQTVINQLPKYFQQYPEENRKLLNEFHELLSCFDEAELNREGLKKRFNNYTSRLLGTDNYIQTPFLWFSITFFQKASQTLELTDFQGQSFYKYFAKQLRVWNAQPGVFELIRKITPLNDLAWEHLQYRSIQMTVPLSIEQYNTIKKMYALVKGNAIDTLNPTFVRSQLVGRFSKDFKTTKELTSLFTLLESVWRIDYHSPAFGIERLFYHIQSNQKSIEEIIGYHNSNNTLLNISDIFKVKNKSMDYIGVLYVPSDDIILLEKYLQSCERKGLLNLKILSNISSIRRSISLDFYKADVGWLNVEKPYLNQITSHLRNNKLNSTLDENFDYLSPITNQEWHFNLHKMPEEIIKLYCELPSLYTFSDLLTKSKRRNSLSVNLIKRKGLLRQLLYNNVVSIYWIPRQLVYEYSLTYYYVVIPKTEIEQILSLLSIFPYSILNLSKEHIFVWAHLAPEIAKWINERLKWDLYEVRRYISPWKAEYSWFDEDQVKWVTPKILQ